MPGDEVVSDEIYDSVGMRLLLVLEVESLMHLLDSDGLLVGLVAQNELLKEQEGAFMMNTLSDLDLRLPSMGCV